MKTNQDFVSKELIFGHTIVIASQLTKKGCKIFSYVVGKGYCVSYSVTATKEDWFGSTEDMEDAMEMYNSVFLGD